jgi:predicted nucleic acid-binding protein
MAAVAADTSFLFSLYGNDAHSPAARAWTQRAKAPLIVTALGRFEFGNAMRFAAFRRAIPVADALASLAAFEADWKAGFLQPGVVDLSVVVARAARLSELHTLAGGHRAFDLLHVAAALTLKATTFLSFDTNQRRLAIVAGLSVGP